VTELRGQFSARNFPFAPVANAGRGRDGFRAVNLENDMRKGVSKTLIGSLAALAIGTATLTASAPASAQNWRGGGWHGGGWHGGGWHGGGWHGGGWGWHRGWGWRGGWGPGWGGGWWGAPVVVGGALAVGAIASASSCWQVRPVFDAWGNYLGQSTVNACY